MFQKLARSWSSSTRKAFSFADATVTGVMRLRPAFDVWALPLAGVEARVVWHGGYFPRRLKNFFIIIPRLSPSAAFCSFLVDRSRPIIHSTHMLLSL